ncbi:MAG: hypothetical protein AB8B65_16695 [Kordia sp.]|uniref:hypothetical protein n=1 Tax=Kordia sp. TaxID=1965332 RepID=UPI00385F6F99
MTEFTERYKKLPQEELLDIISNASKYQSIAVDTAKKELLSRGVLEEHLDELIAQNIEDTKQQQKLLQEKQQKKDAITKAIFDPINPLLEGLGYHERQTRFMSWIFTGIGLYVAFVFIRVFVQYYSLIVRFSSSIFSVDFSESYILLLYLLYLIPIIVGPILFWKRTQFGWILVTFTIVSGVLSNVFDFIYYANLPYFRFEQMIDRFMMSNLNIVLFLVCVFFFIYSWNFLVKRKTKAVFNVTKIGSILTFIVALALQVALWYPLFIH